jgi:hypothetical protein
MLNCIKYIVDHQPKGTGINAYIAPVLYYLAIGAAVCGVVWLGLKLL